MNTLQQSLAGSLCAAISLTANAQWECDVPGPDVVVGLLPAPTNYVSANGVEAFSIGATLCNLGNQPLAIVPAPSNQHVIMTQNLYRLSTVNGAARFEQIGMSWVFHTFSVLNQQLCCTTCIPAGQQHLGVRCSCPEPSSIMGLQGVLTPRWQVNAATGTAAQPPANPPFSGTLDRRLQAKIADINPATNPGAQYFGEVIALAPDDAAASNDLNNATYREVVITGSAAAFNMALTSAIHGGEPAIHAWKNSDPSVVQTFIDIPDDGRMILAAKATQISPSLWRYEYALYNLNSDRSAQEFSIPIPSTATITNIGFHDVDYHSGDGLGVTTDGADWPGTISKTSVSWSTQTLAQNANANALRWGTLYNFRFDADVPPAAALGDAVISTFKVAGTHSALTIVPQTAALCPADIAPQGKANGIVDVDDLLLVINNWAQLGANVADITGNGVVDVDDLLAVINAWGACQ